MFKLTKASEEGPRTGILQFDGKEKATPTYFMTSNFGGGASDLYRIVTYIDLLEESSIPVLFNYYFLTVGGTFPVKWTKFISRFDDILDFMIFIRDQFFKEGMVKEGYPKKDVDWNPVTMLDSGSGNILRDMVEKRKVKVDEVLSYYEKLIPSFLSFADENAFNLAVAMDFAGKYTYKKGEAKDILYGRLSRKFSQDLSSNLKLLGITLDLLKKENSKCAIFAPVRGQTAKQYGDYTEKVLDLEKKKNVKFEGFALGGLADYRLKDNEIWNVPASASMRIKAGLIVRAAAESVRSVLRKAGDERPIHALGVGDVSRIIPLVFSGIDMFDCHTPWRRATDGNRESARYVMDKDTRGRSFSKFLIPAIDSKGNVISENEDRLLRYVKLPEVSETVVCDCEICRDFSVREIKELYSGSREDYYFARMLMYVHAILQHEYICNRLRQEIEQDRSIVKFIEELPDPELKNELLRIVEFDFVMFRS